ncbi:MAG: FAD:protein FMN transferase [Catonella sp.]|uniref:FAD:protein FMN transferase n=1 Tax=Catonella sp. TaxID=2382125 RepID=UPI003FA0F8E5
MNKVFKKIICFSIFTLTVAFSASCSKSDTGMGKSDNIVVGSQGTGSEKLSAASDSEREEASESELFALDTVITLKVYGRRRNEVLKKLENRINELDELLSTGKETSEVSILNKSGKAVLSKTGTELMKRSLELNRKTDGLFDITIYPLMELWGFTSKNYKVPSDKEIKEKLKNVGSDKIIFDEPTGEISFKNEGMKIDFGGIGKGYITDELVKVLTEEGVESAIINLGGNVFGFNKKPDGSLWNVAIRDPNQIEEYMLAIRIENSAVITSGGYERYFEENGVRYHHILDPRSGRPSDSGLKSVSIVSRDGTLADTLSTSLFIMGEDGAIKYWKENGSNFDIILFTNDNRLLVSEGIKDQVVTDRYDVRTINR